MNRNINLLWKDFKGIRKLNSINSDSVLGADIAHSVRLSKEKSGQLRSIRSSGWFNGYSVCGTATITQTSGSSLSALTVNSLDFATKSGASGSSSAVFTYDGTDWVDSDNNKVDLADYGISFTGTPVANDEITIAYNFEKIIRLFSANMSGYTYSNQLVAFTKTASNINVWIITDDTLIISPFQIATFPLVTDVTDVCMTQWGDRLGIVFAFGKSVNYLGFVYYSADAVIGGTQYGSTGFYYRQIQLSGAGFSGTTPIIDISSLKSFGSRLAVNGYTTYDSGKRESIYGVWFSEAGNPLNFSMDYISSATDTSAFYVETGEYVNKLEEYHGLTAFCKNRSYNITGSSQNDYKVRELTAKGVFGNATFTLNGKCAYVDSWSNNIFTLRDNIDGTIGFDDPIGDDIQDYLTDVEEVTINVIGRRVRMLKSSGQSLVYDVDIGEWTEESFVPNARAVTFLNKELFCDKNAIIYEITDSYGAYSQQTPNENGYYSHYRTNLIWLDSQSSVKNHLYPFAIVLEPNTLNNFHIKFTTDRGNSYEYTVTKASFENIATYSNDDTVPADGSMFVDNDDDLSGGVFFSISATELLVTVDRPPFWRYLQMDIYTVSPEEQFNISGIEAKNTNITDEMLEY